MNISAVIHNLLHKDKNFFEEIYKEYAEKVFKTAYMTTKSYSAAEDITQEVFYNIYRNIKKLKSFEAFPSWVNKITVNTTINYLKKERKVILISEESIVEEIEDTNRLAAEDIVLEKEFHEVVMSLIYGLPDNQCIPVILYYYNNMTYEEIAKSMNCSEGTIKSRLHNAKKKLREKLFNYQYFKEGEECSEYR